MTQDYDTEISDEIYKEQYEQKTIIQEGEDSSHPSDNNINEQILESLFGLSSELSSIRTIVENRLTYDKAKEEAFDRLYAELDELKRDSLFEYLRPFFFDLILLFDRIESTRQSMNQNATLDKSLRDLLKTLSDELLEVLHRKEVELIKTSSATFDAVLQRAIGTEPTAIEIENSQIARVVRRGFKFRERILRAEEVIVKKYRRTIGTTTLMEEKQEEQRDKSETKEES